MPEQKLQSPWFRQEFATAFPPRYGFRFSLPYAIALLRLIRSLLNNTVLLTPLTNSVVGHVKVSAGGRIVPAMKIKHAPDHHGIRNLFCMFYQITLVTKLSLCVFLRTAYRAMPSLGISHLVCADRITPYDDE